MSISYLYRLKLTNDGNTRDCYSVKRPLLLLRLKCQQSCSWLSHFDLWQSLTPITFTLKTWLRQTSHDKMSGSSKEIIAICVLLFEKIFFGNIEVSFRVNFAPFYNLPIVFSSLIIFATENFVYNNLTRPIMHPGYFFRNVIILNLSQLFT